MLNLEFRLSKICMWRKKKNCAHGRPPLIPMFLSILKSLTQDSNRVVVRDLDRRLDETQKRIWVYALQNKVKRNFLDYEYLKHAFFSNSSHDNKFLLFVYLIKTIDVAIRGALNFSKRSHTGSNFGWKCIAWYNKENYICFILCFKSTD